MPQYKVGVVLSATVGRFRSAFRRVAGDTRKVRGAFQAATGAGRGLGAATDDAGRRAQSAMRRAAGQTGSLAAALRRTSGQARRTGDTIHRSAARADRGVRGHIRSWRNLVRTMLQARRASVAAGAGIATGGGAAMGGFRRLGGMAATAAGGFSVMQLARGEMDMETRYNWLGLQAQQTPAQMREWRARIEATATRDEIRVPTSALLAVVEAIQERTGRFDVAMAELDTLAVALRRSSAVVDDAVGSTLGYLVSDLRKLGVTGGAELQSAYAAIVEGERSGAFTIADFARVGAPLLSAAASAGGERTAVVPHLVAMAQMGHFATGDPSRSITAAEALMRPMLADERKMDEIRKLGVSLDQAPDVIATQLLDRVGGQVEKLSHLFEEDGRRILLALASDAGRAFYRDVYRAASDAQWATVPAEAARAGATSAARVQQTQDRFAADIGEHASGAMHSVVAALNENLGLIVGASIAAGAGVKAGRWMWNRRSAAGGGGAFDRAAGGRRRGGGMAGAGSIAPVVRRMTVGTLIARRVAGGGGWVGGRGGRAGRRGGRVGGRGMLGRVPMAGALAPAAIAGFDLIQGDVAGALRTGGTAIGMAAGSAAWAAAGATLGSVVPGLGTMLGGLVGSLLFQAIGGLTAGVIMDAVFGDPAQREFTPSELRRRERRRRRAEQRRERLTATDGPAAADPPDAGSPGPRLSRLERRRRRKPAPPAGSLRTAEVALPEKRESRYERLRARPAAPTVVDRRDQRISITLNAPPGADAEEIARRVSEEVDRVNRRRDQEREDSLRAVVADRDPTVTRY